MGRIVLGRKVPAIRTAKDEALFFKCLQSLTEPGVVDVKQLAQRSPGNWLRRATQFAANRFGKRKWCDLIAVDEEPERLVIP